MWAYATNHTPNHVRNEVGGQLKNIRNQGRITLDTFSIIPISIFSFIGLHPSIYLFNFFPPKINQSDLHYNFTHAGFAKTRILLTVLHQIQHS